MSSQFILGPLAKVKIGDEHNWNKNFVWELFWQNSIKEKKAKNQFFFKKNCLVSTHCSSK
jgi:hypothetical protein